mmetsp:Transcript_23248/g.68748  ORF Transcript_23248/g.68748 Transcript_23248/m.68748 type:complete len:902 (-) Transcript_23248:201-2906(-)
MDPIIGSSVPWSAIRYGLVFLTWGVVTCSYYSFSHSIHHLSFNHFNSSEHGGGNNSSYTPHGNGGGGDGYHEGNHSHSESHGGHDEHGHGGSFDRFHDKYDSLFLYGLALPIVLLTLLTLIWNPSTRVTKANAVNAAAKNNDEKKNKENKSPGEVNVQKWTIIWFVLPLFLVMLDGSQGHHSQGKDFGWDLYIRICMSLMSPSGYAATWSLSLFLIPVTRHSPILDWLRVTPVQALAFHRVSGWVGFWNSVLHGFLHLRHLMDVQNPGHLRPWQEQLKILLVPSSWGCIATQDPLKVFFGEQESLDGDGKEGRQCWLALVNATGMISVVAYLLLAITSLPRVRRYSYTLFYRVHIPAAWTMLFTAIWHYPTCALILIPNIIYYLSFHIPVYVTQAFEYYKNLRRRPQEKNESPLVEANLIPGGSIELILATSNDEDHCRHENIFVRLSHPSVSKLSHPFSVFHCQDLMNQCDESSSSSSLKTLSMLLRPTRPFTDGLTKVLFPNHEVGNENDGSRSLSSSLSSSYRMLQFDSYYAGSFDWVERAMSSHDEILLVAGGVGIVPFLEFLPALKRRIEAGHAVAASRTATRTSDTNGSYVPVPILDGDSREDALLPELSNNGTKIGPKKIRLHWYCREIGLASHVWHEYLHCHADAWENQAWACQGRFEIHLHLTSLRNGGDSATTAEEGSGGVEVTPLTSVPNLGVVKKNVYYDAAGEDQQEGTIRPVQNARFTQSVWLGLLLPGSLMAVGTMLHWIWYKRIIMNDKFRDDNLVLRSHSIIFTLILSMVLSVLVEHYCLRRDHSCCADDPVPMQVSSTSDVDIPPPRNNTMTTLEDEMDAMRSSSLLVLTKGRPPMHSVIEPVLKAGRPGVYSCGPHSLMESVEGSIRSKRKDCAFYREDSEM